MIISEAAEFLGISERQIMRLISDGKLKATKTLLPIPKVVMMQVWDIDEDAVYDRKSIKDKEVISDLL
jgi:hypothetical protein